MRTFDVRFKKKGVREYLSGKGGYKILAARYDIADSLIRRWVGAYRHHGCAGLVRQCGRYTYEFKLEVLHCLATERACPAANWRLFTISAIRIASRCGSNSMSAENFACRSTFPHWI
ncbi:MAG: transposase, partial [Pseudomonadota bacterium]|nr:transposase [Pseudomonadota bacterium]